LTIALDIAFVLGLTSNFKGDLGVWIDLGTSLLYVVSLAMILAGIVGADPVQMLTRTGRTKSKAAQRAWQRFRPAIPLLLGTLAAYIGVAVWARLNESVTRTGAQAAGVIHQEYFAQLSQIIPLLLVAVGLEAHFFKRLLTEPVQRAMTIVSIVILCIGEALAISALPTDNEGPGDVLHGWHEYTAFVLTVQGVAVVLTILVWALVDESSGTTGLSTTEGRTEPTRSRGA
jgi:hypothetical protein